MRRGLLLRAIQIELIIVLVGYFVPFGGLVVGVYDFPWRLANQIGLGLLFGGWLFWKIKTRRGPIKTSLDWLIGAWLALMLLTSLFSLDPRLSWEMVAYVGAHILWYYVALDLFQREQLLNDTILAVAVVGTAIAALGLVEYIAIAGWWGITTHRIKSVLLNPNILGAFLTLAFGFTLYHLSNLRSTLAKRGWMTALIIITAAILLTRSRGAWLNLAVLITSVVIIKIILDGAWQSWIRRQLLWSGLVVLVMALAVLIVLNNRAGSNQVRLVTWQAALQMVADRPFLGVGPGMYGRMFLAYKYPQDQVVIQSHAINTPLTVVAEMGVLSGLLLIMGTVLWLREVWRRFQHASSELDRWQRIVSLATVTGFLAHSQVESFFHYPMFMFLIIILVARLLASDLNIYRSWRGLLLPALTLALTAAIVIRTTPAYALYHKARTASLNRDWESTGEYLNRAITADPDFRFYQRQLAVVQGVSALEHHPVKADDFRGFTNAFGFTNFFAPDHAHLACLEFVSGNLPEAISQMERAHFLSPKNSRYAFNLGMYYEAAGQIDQAKEQYEQVAKNSDPSVLASEFWRGTPARQAIRPDLAAATLSTIPEDDYAERGAILAIAGEREAAQRYYDLQTGTDDPISGWIGMAKLALIENDVDVALKDAELALALEPDNTEALLVRARTYLAAGDVKEAASDLETVNELKSTPEARFYWAEVARMQGDLTMAEQRYLDTIRLGLPRRYSKDVEGYANLIGRRPGLGVDIEDLDCLAWPYVPEAVSLPAARLASIYHDRGDTKALQNLQQMLPYHMR